LTAEIVHVQQLVAFDARDGDDELGLAFDYLTGKSSGDGRGAGGWRTRIRTRALRWGITGRSGWSRICAGSRRRRISTRPRWRGIGLRRRTSLSHEELTVLHANDQPLNSR
jgi:hypothetical protein